MSLSRGFQISCLTDPVHFFFFFLGGGGGGR